MSATSRSSGITASSASLLALFAIAGIALAVRSLGFESVFVGDEVVFPPADPQYHVRRALYTFTNFPAVLLFDPYINYPGGASVPWPPLFDFLAGALARLLASDIHGFEVVVAWLPPALALLTLVPIYLAGRLIGSPAVGLLAAFFFALLPISASYTRLANVDHHAAVGAIGAWLLYLSLALVDADHARGRMRRLGVALTVARLALLLSWHGSLLYLVLLDGALLLASIVSGRRDLLQAQCLGALASAACLAPILLASPTPLLGDYSSIALSWLHVLAVLAVACTSAGLLLAGRLRPALTPIERVGWTLGACGLFLLVLLFLPGPREGLLHGLRFVAMRDDVGQITGEQSPLFPLFGRAVARPAELSWGLFGVLIPFAPVVAPLLARRSDTPARRRPGLWLLGGWGLFFGLLALLQRRYGNDFAPAASLLFALWLRELARGISPRIASPRHRRLLSGAIAAVLCIALFWPAIARVHAPRARLSYAVLSGRPWPRDQVEQSVGVSLMRFCKELRRITPETASFLAPGPPPEYGVIAHANLGHAIHYTARRATATDPFWEYIGRDNWSRSFAFLAEPDEARALDLAQVLKGRFVVTTPHAVPSSLVEQLHRHDGRAVAHRPRVEHMRLLTEAPASGRSVGEILNPGPRDSAPYKLFEIVEGAELVVATLPGAEVTAAVEIRTPAGRSFEYRARAYAAADGVARLRVPYSTEAVAPARASGPYRVISSGRQRLVAVPEQAVQQGASIEVRAEP